MKGQERKLTPTRLIVEKENTEEELSASRQGCAIPGLRRRTPPFDSPHRKSAGPSETARVICASHHQSAGERRENVFVTYFFRGATALACWVEGGGD